MQVIDIKRHYQHQVRTPNPAWSAKLALVMATMVLSLAFNSAGRAQDAATPDDPSQARRALEQQKQQLDDNAAKQREIQSEVGDLDAERERLNGRLVETAALIQRSEAKMTSIEGRMSELEVQERAARAVLEERHGQIASLFIALQRMGRNPPPVLITRREDALKMVRSAMLLASAFPELRDQALSLGTRLEDLQRVMTSIRTEGERLQAETDRLNDARNKLGGLMEAKKLTLADRQSQLVAVRAAAADISKNVSNLSDLIGRLDQAVTEKTGLGAYNEELKTKQDIRPATDPTVPHAPAEPVKTAEASAAPAVAVAGPQIVEPPPTEENSEPPAAAVAKEEQVAILAPEHNRGSVVELAPSGDALMPGGHGRIKPAIPFSQAKGRLPLPAQGRRVIAFGERTQFGGQSKGIVMETRASAQVTSPCDGWVAYAGEFRSYGQLLIINAGDGYHMVLAGLSQIDVQPGQFVLTAEPVGTMSGDQKGTSPSADVSGPVLYIELRKDGRSVDPEPWWATGQQKVQG